MKDYIEIPALEPLMLCSAPGDTDESIDLTPTVWALEQVAKHELSLVYANEHVNADVMLKRYNGTTRLWGGYDFIWWCFLANLAELNVAEFFAETQDKLTIDCYFNLRLGENTL
jgi:hypothetical protein